MTGDSYYGESGVPYCAMFQSWCLAQAGVTAAGMPGAYCPSILSAARSAGALVYNEDAQPGDLLLFDWGGDGTPDHIGCCEVNHPSGSYMETIEGNTNNGCVIRPTYSATPSHRHAAVQLYDGNATDAQRLTRSAHDDGSKSYVFTSCGLALDVCNGRGEAGTPVQAYERNDTKAQGWVMEDVENASVYKPGNSVRRSTATSCSTASVAARSTGLRSSSGRTTAPRHSSGPSSTTGTGASRSSTWALARHSTYAAAACDETHR
jgi:hypothetical protein